MLLNSFSKEEINDKLKKLKILQSNIKLVEGNIGDELIEQAINIFFIKENSTVLELGGNIGRNSCIISSILSDSSKLVTIEPCENTAQMLRHNRDINNMKFHIENAALSNTKLCHKITKPYDLCLTTIQYEEKVPEGYIPVMTLTFNELQNKYNLVFDTIVADCEGAMYYILKNDPSILKNINMIFIEHDYQEKDQKVFVTELLKNYGFKLVFNYDNNFSDILVSSGFRFVYDDKYRDFWQVYIK